MIKSFKSLADMSAAFPDEDACINHFRAVRWPVLNGVDGVGLLLEPHGPPVARVVVPPPEYRSRRASYWTVTCPFMHIARCGVQ